MKTIGFSLLLIFVFTLFSINMNAQLSGRSYLTSSCASGGFDYHFFKNNKVVAVCDGCERIPYILSGTYKVSGSNVYVHMTNSWYGEGKGDITYVAAINHYETYAARHSSYEEKFDIPLDWFNGEATESCEEVGNQTFNSSDPHYFLRNKLEGRYPETCTRLLTPYDLKNKTDKELRLMRNEIYARYGYSFKSKDLKTYFESQNGYYSSYSDVEAWLSEIEKKNVKMIQFYEKK